MACAAGVRAAGLLAGVAVDAVLGDPRRGHPVAVFGRAAAALERRIYADSKVAGVVYTGACVTGAAALGLVADRLAARHGAPARTVLMAAATWAVIGGTSLGREGTLMARLLEDTGGATGRDTGEDARLDAARRRLSHLCARDPQGLDAKDLARATVESIAENTSDAAVAPLLWGAIGGVPALLAYRAVNTLDAMVGYRDTRYRDFGWASARLDDVANWVPARMTGLLTVACAPVVCADRAKDDSQPSPGAERLRSARDAVRRSYESLRRDGGAHPSPNAGRCEAAFAGALGVRLGGTNTYGGEVERRPELGRGEPPEAVDIHRAVRLSTAVTVAAAALTATVSVMAVKGQRRLRPQGR
ncbi:MAG TPA: cobalamin biosynthesis protein [Actinomadura sp.]|nr:cobalamin biosynthesis protein [Actinomadura sp.]